MTPNPAHRNLTGRRPIRQPAAWSPARRRPRRALSAAAAGAAACTVAIALAACGTGPAGSGAAGPAGTGHPASPAASGRAHSPSPASGQRHAAKVALEITVRGLQGRPSRHWTLQCLPPGGTHPDAVRACRALLRSWHPLALERRHRMECPMIAETSGQAEISGTWFGHKVHRLVINGGCDVGLWAELGPVFH